MINGQALCPRCNLNKGDKTVSTREWQTRAALKFKRTHPNDFLVSAAPGAGKTRFALSAASDLRDSGLINRIIIVCPSAHLRNQWAESAHAHAGLDIDPYFQNGDGMFSRDYDGVAVTYHAVAKNPAIYRRMTGTAQTLVILDEIHHAGEAEHLSWGDSLREAFDTATRRLALSGTPFRSDDHPIPFVRYEPNAEGLMQSKADFEYDYGQALRDGVVRPVVFNAKDGESKWQDARGVKSSRLDTAVKADWKKAIRTALIPDGNWIPSVLKDANAELVSNRTIYPNAGGLVIAEDQFKARQYAKLLEQISGSTVRIAVSDDRDASQTIETFAASTDPWLVAVRMVSEGVDIPRLTVGVYATNTVAPLFFTQVVGRFVRRSPGDDDIVASLYIPSVPPLIEYATKIEEARDHVLNDMGADSPAVDDVDESGDRGDYEPGLFLPIDASDGIAHSTIRHSVVYAPDEIAEAERAIATAGLGPSYRPEDVAKLMRMFNAERPSTVRPALDGSDYDGPSLVLPAPSDVKLADQIKAKKNQLKIKVNRLVRKTGTEQRYIYSDLNRAVGEKSTKAATVRSLDARIKLVNEWLARA